MKDFVLFIRSVLVLVLASGLSFAQQATDTANAHKEQKVEVLLSREALAADLKARLADLPEAASDAERQAVIEAWRSENRELLDALRDTPEPSAPSERPRRENLPPRVPQGDATHNIRRLLLEERSRFEALQQQFVDTLKDTDLTPEQRRELIQKHREEMRSQREAMRQRLKDYRLDADPRNDR